MYIYRVHTCIYISIHISDPINAQLSTLEGIEKQSETTHVQQ